MGESFKSKIPLDEAITLSNELVFELIENYMDTVAIAGSVRRLKPEVGDIDIVVIGDITKLKGEGHIWRYVDGGTKKCTVDYKGRQVNIVSTTREALGAALLYFTGNSQYNIIMRAKAKRQGLKLNEYGLWRGEERIAGETEQGIYMALGLEPKSPDQRSK